MRELSTGGDGVSELYSDTARFRDDLDRHITRDDRPDDATFGSPVTCDECEETHPSDDYAAEDGWTIVHTDDCDVVLCPGHTAAVAAQDAADLASGAYFTPGVTQAHGCLDALAHCAVCNGAQS